jgi:hypothetical protein
VDLGQTSQHRGEMKPQGSTYTDYFNLADVTDEGRSVIFKIHESKFVSEYNV